MSSGEKAFIEYEWGPPHERVTMTFSRETIIRNAMLLLAGGVDAAPGICEVEKAAWRTATKRGVRKLAYELADGEVRLVVQADKASAVSDVVREATQAWLDDNAHIVQAAVQEGVQTALDNSPHLFTNAIHDAASGWFSGNGDQIRHAIRAAALQAAREANI